MGRLMNWAAWLVVILIGALAALNWTALAAPVDMDLLLTRLQAPLGLVLLGLTAALVLLFLAATLFNRFGAMVESRRLLQEVRDANALAQKAEASRFETLQQQMQAEFQKLREALAASSRPDRLS